MNEKELKFNKEAEIISRWHERGKRKIIFILAFSSFFIKKGIFFLTFGIAFAALFGMANELTIIYDSNPLCANKTSCNITFSIKQSWSSQIHLYYVLDNFDQNYDSYYESFSLEQLRGEEIDNSDLSSCGKAYTNGFMGYSKDFSGKNNLTQSDPAIPCGFVAYSMFNGNYFI